MFKGCKVRFIIILILGLLTVTSYGKVIEDFSVNITEDTLIVNDGATYKLNNLIINTGMLSTMLEKGNKNSFFLIYDSASSTMMNKMIVQVYWKKPFLHILTVTKIFRDRQTGIEFGWIAINNRNQNKQLTYEYITEKIANIDYDLVSDKNCRYRVDILSKSDKFTVNGCSKNNKIPMFFLDGSLLGYYTYTINSLYLDITPKIRKTFHINEKFTININIKNFTTYNNIAYYLQKSGANKEAIYLLERILEKYPNRTVVYYNLGDAYWGLGKKKKAKQAYQTYIKQMKEKGKEKKIPKIVIQRVQ